jgi:hypothetical protein
MGVKMVGKHRRRGNRGGGACHRRRSLGQFRPLHGPGSRVRPGGASWHLGGADVGVGRGWGAAERPVHGEAGSSARWSERAVMLGFGLRP